MTGKEKEALRQRVMGALASDIVQALRVQAGTVSFAPSQELSKGLNEAADAIESRDREIERLRGLLQDELNCSATPASSGDATRAGLTASAPPYPMCYHGYIGGCPKCAAETVSVRAEK